jgi:two-component system, OmpR family, alkaline phosphatase synthesis response regulator PhoP
VRRCGPTDPARPTSADFRWGRARANGVMTRDVLVVDDDRSILDLLTDLLEEEGYRVRRAADGLAALAEVERTEPDLVVTDVMMPRLNGMALAAELRQRGIPTIVTSAAVPTVDDPCLAFIPKPFDIERLLDLVATVLEAC